MAFTENLNVFFDEFTDEVIYDNAVYSGMLDEPDEIIADNTILSTEYELKVKTSDFKNVLFEKTMLVNTIPYTVRNMRKIDDGKISIISLSKDDDD
tara:strand:+ start:1187 stop:1474 length:288 start_codon:yes stop_codon:yes gene_type:complete